MLLIAEIVLTVIAWNRGWKWFSLMPLGVGAGFAFFVGIVIGAGGGTIENTGVFVILDFIVIITQIVLISMPRVVNIPEVKDTDIIVEKTA
ncbi:MAG: hypothetical protein ACE5KZ_08730 [Candidatus Scalinduaceae bacterium]